MNKKRVIIKCHCGDKVSYAYYNNNEFTLTSNVKDAGLYYLPKAGQLIVDLAQSWKFDKVELLFVKQYYVRVDIGKRTRYLDRDGALAQDKKDARAFESPEDARIASMSLHDSILWTSISVEEDG